MTATFAIKNLWIYKFGRCLYIKSYEWYKRLKSDKHKFRDKYQTKIDFYFFPLEAFFILFFMFVEKNHARNTKDKIRKNKIEKVRPNTENTFKFHLWITNCQSSKNIYPSLEPDVFKKKIM